MAGNSEIDGPFQDDSDDSDFEGFAQAEIDQLRAADSDAEAASIGVDSDSEPDSDRDDDDQRDFDHRDWLPLAAGDHVRRRQDVPPNLATALQPPRQYDDNQKLPRMLV